ncbi:MAG: FadR family transcriptional regulator [Spirochaetales bacterium]|nr:FadR family transcriptional regulator [Spirochaetales bacterium]
MSFLKTHSIDIIETILKGIKDGRFPKGKRLPAERELARELEVSRASLREALKILEVIGILETRRGGGSYIGKEINLFPLLSILSPFLFYWDGYEIELVELRILLELIAVEEAAKNINWETARYLREPVRQLRAAVEHNDSSLSASADIDFHERIFRIAQKPVLHKAAELITLLLEVSRRGARSSVIARADHPENLYREHDRIHEAIIAGDVKGARKAMKDHLESVLTIYRKASSIPKY